MMKTTFLFFLFTSLAVSRANAQFPGGFFSQQAAKKRLMLEQIAGIGLYLQGINGGYQIADKGLKAARDLKNGTFGFHTAYFNSLTEVSAVVQSDPKGKMIYDLHRQLARIFDREVAWQQKEKLLNEGELAYLRSVYANLLKRSKEDLDALEAVLTPGKLELTDQQRLERLDSLHKRMRDKYAFAGYFTAKCRKLAMARIKANQEKEQLRKLYGIN